MRFFWGAKKHTYTLRESLSDKKVDVSEVPLSKSFPQPDYASLVDNGVSPEILAFVASMRASIPAGFTLVPAVPGMITKSYIFRCP